MNYLFGSFVGLLMICFSDPTFGFCPGASSYFGGACFEHYTQSSMMSYPDLCSQYGCYKPNTCKADAVKKCSFKQSCPENYVLVNSQCISNMIAHCPYGATLKQGHCVPKVTTVECSEQNCCRSTVKKAGECCENIECVSSEMEKEIELTTETAIIVHTPNIGYPQYPCVPGTFGCYLPPPPQVPCVPGYPGCSIPSPGPQINPCMGGGCSMNFCGSSWCYPYFNTFGHIGK